MNKNETRKEYERISQIIEELKYLADISPSLLKLTFGYENKKARSLCEKKNDSTLNVFDEINIQNN